MKSNPYEKIIQTMRDEGAKQNPQSIKLGTIKSIEPFLLSIGALELDEDDVLISEHLLNIDTKANISWHTESAGESPHTHHVNGEKTSALNQLYNLMILYWFIELIILL